MKTTTHQPLVRIVDDNDALRDSLEFMLRAEGLATAAYSNATDFLRNDAPSRPGCLVLDVKMPGMTGLELQQEMNRRAIALPVIFLTAHGDIGMAVDTFHEGAADFLQKPVDPVRLVEAVKKAIALDESRRGQKNKQINAPEALSAREAEVLRFAAAGKTSQEIAETLGLSRRTVEHYRAGALRKLGLSDASEYRPEEG